MSPCAPRWLTWFCLAVWLTVTQHCALEAAGFWESDHGVATHACCDTTEACAADNCELVEGANAVRLDTNDSPVLPPESVTSILALLVGAWVPPFAPPALHEDSRADDSDGWVPTWTHDRRLAGWPGAPAV